MTRKLFVLLVVALFVYIFAPVAAAVGMGAVFAVMFYPWMKRIEPKKFPNSIAAGLFTFTVTILLFVPVTALTVAGVRAGLKELHEIKITTFDTINTDSTLTPTDQVLDRMLDSVGIDKVLEKISRFTPVDSEAVFVQLKNWLGSALLWLRDILTRFISQFPALAAAFAVFLFSFYYFLADGPKLVEFIRKRSFFTSGETNKLFNAFAGLCRSVILASLVSGLIQAAIATIFCLGVGINKIIIVFFVIFTASFIPLIGASPIVFVIAAQQFFSGHTGAGIVLAIGGIVVGTVDNLIRPMVIRGSANLHPLLAFISALGGLHMLGALGVFLGPVIAGLFVEVINIQLISE